MERRGIRIDLKKFEWLENTTGDVFDAVVREMKRHLAVQLFEKKKGDFNPSSTIHLRSVVYDILNMPITKKTGNGAPSVDRETMDGLAGRDPLIDLIIEYKEVQKIKSTYIEGLKDKIIDGRVHTQYLTHVARSGRTASSKPNLQNLPIAKEGSVMNKYGLHIRDMFVPDHGCEFDEVDYNQHELRIMCIASKDPVMKHIFTNDLDIHEETARGVFGTDNISTSMRRQAKVINFGILYGMGYSRLAGQLGISPNQARGYIRRFFAKYWKVRAWQSEMERFVRKHGYIETLTGRKRRFPGIDGVLSHDDVRQAINTPIQGTASDLLLYSIIGIAKRFKYHKMKSTLCAQVHDSLLINVFNGEGEQVREICHDVMLNPPVDFNLYVPLKVGFKSGASWGSLRK
jgi:DNA polymerase-1